MRARRMVSAVMNLFLIVALLGQDWPGGATARAAPAAPDTPQSGTFSVNTLGDNTTADSLLTLREAILLANGGTGGDGVSTGLGRALKDGEIAQISGCTFSGSTNNWTISSGCGAGVLDFVTFDASLGTSPNISLGAPLPSINDSQPLVLNGGSVRPIIEASSLSAGQSALTVLSNANLVEHLTIENSPNHGVAVTGGSNTLFDLTVWNSTQEGIDLSVGGNNTVDNSLIGIYSPTATSCGAAGNHGGGIVLHNGANHSQVKNSYIGCNGFISSTLFAAAIAIIDPSSTFNTIGPNNIVGTDGAHNIDLGNGGSGLVVDSDDNTVISNTLMFNDDGVTIGAAFNGLGGNIIRRNKFGGIYLFDQAHDNRVGGPSFGSTLTGNLISGNTYSGVILQDANVHANLIAGNRIGTTADGLSADPNTEAGVRLDGVHDNFIGDNAAAPNIIAGNTKDGVWLVNGANRNQIANNLIGESASLAPLPNGASGILLDTAANDNSLSANTIAHNARNGIQLDGAAVVSNTVAGDAIHDNTQDGINERNGAAFNAWTQISTYNNGGLGIDKFAPADFANVPSGPFVMFTSAVRTGSMITLSGQATPSGVGTTTTVEIYQIAADPSGYGEGRTYVASALVNNGGAWTASFAGSALGCYTAFQTVSAGGAETSSEFGRTSCFTYLPIIRR